MNEIITFVEELAQRNHLVGFLFGVGFCVIVWFFWLRSYFDRSHKEEMERLRDIVE